ncbi:putative metal-dependent hydrolase [Clostridium pasteurianum DSM 525 = ATCC 6013]|uniref:Putative metal-dependent hydrolase n=1 Tax=Clostridium pasteurianum DSM 525 = ATCC 6013 TaxID=1262449 RepID=A0A0H3J501_CLOPA|nr:SprT family zinc-dependent metalloprotease [Clostridium pasteurianum]AJA48589.1 putative metal-dependent hydrolase [Clostridium pasteurianum DSM 525 = ATCC 6013]AJA52577.1 putative metal-dependent hydrolase [Clostridium pasteurianum DSM 525 = ATCC 6013]AOZ75820.1 metal-dependent hydrolase [Clostridium pasteurianum DSM 525 = ATCC 6013]AOZ79616.1 metal-dependent hydrolase [Clostridium pasteurianum]ELP57933.1 putative metal-dependent hydrolase [Clostridium pasteurianum DSM 525 = ATCC 6013]
MILKFIYAGKEIEFEVIFSKRKTMEISINPNGDIKVRSPVGISEEVIIEQMRVKATWIVKKLYQLKHRRIKSLIRKFVNEEIFMYLGKEYFLYIDRNPNVLKPEVSLVDDKIIVTIDNKNEENIRKIMELWYREKAKQEIIKRINFYQKFFDKVPLEVKIKEQKRRWGSCTYRDSLLFNWRCVMAREDVLDYIVVHEMCHMVQKNHSKQYWDLVHSILPDYKKRHQWLKDNTLKMDF